MSMSPVVLLVSVAFWSVLVTSSSVLAKCRCSLDEIPQRGFSWDRDRGYDGSVAIVVSLGSKTLRVYRGGRIVGIARILVGDLNNISRGAFALNQDVKGPVGGPALDGAYRWRVHPLFQAPDGGSAARPKLPFVIPMDFAKDLAKISNSGAIVVVTDGHPKVEEFVGQWPLHEFPVQVASVGKLEDALVHVDRSPLNRLHRLARVALPIAKATQEAAALVISRQNNTATLVRRGNAVWTEPVRIKGRDPIGGSYYFLSVERPESGGSFKWLALRSLGRKGPAPVIPGTPNQVLGRIQIENVNRLVATSLSLNAQSVMVLGDGAFVGQSSRNAPAFDILVAHPPLPVRKSKVTRKRYSEPNRRVRRASRPTRKAIKRVQYASRRRRPRRPSRYDYYRTDRPLFRPEMLVGL